LSAVSGWLPRSSSAWAAAAAGAAIAVAAVVMLTAVNYFGVQKSALATGVIVVVVLADCLVLAFALPLMSVRTAAGRRRQWAA